MAFREKCLKYFNGLDKAMNAFLKKTPEPSYLPSVLDLVSQIIYYAHSIIYIKVNSLSLFGFCFLFNNLFVIYFVR